jgi:Bacterial pre-peptidase C-terminal domain
MGPSARPAPTPSPSGSARGSAGALIGCLLALAAAAPLAAQAPKSAGPARPPAPPAAARPPADTASNPIHAPGAVGTIAVGETVRGELARGDQIMSDSTFADVWDLAATAGEHVEIDLRSDDFDTYLQLLDPSGTVIGQDDDSGGDLNSHLAITLPAGGTYRIVVNSAGHEPRVGTYTLGVR